MSEWDFKLKFGGDTVELMTYGFFFFQNFPEYFDDWPDLGILCLGISFPLSTLLVSFMFFLLWSLQEVLGASLKAPGGVSTRVRYAFLLLG